ncbi:MAG: hypothetical protein A4E26_01744 [Methanobacterium sp. PtaU1.Bin097]|nr:MAG: hypothetical protein A4E26_01744 [Methanobacterium sp. PtaU1.Bin097]
MTSEIVERKCWLCGYIEKQPFTDTDKCPICGVKNPWMAMGAMIMSKPKQDWTQGHNSLMGQAMKIGISKPNAEKLQDIQISLNNTTGGRIDVLSTVQRLMMPKMINLYKKGNG